MTEHELPRIESLFQAAADLPPEERAGFLDRECAGAPELRVHVERLLGRLDAGESLGEGPRRVHAGPVLAAASLEGPGSVIDRYKLLQIIGEGGFGVVYMAEQQEPVQRKVAVKVIKLGMDTGEVIARFEAERQALALMDHPGIAKVLDGGTTASGRPYFVMELVRGIAITDYCDKHALDTGARLELFLRTCHAVHHAHQKGVIHRDLKPSNVLVTSNDGEPVPKIIDFGVAKAMHGRLTDRTLFTRYEQFIGTPAYMSPEQAEMSALDVDTRSDIYSLGVLLYELLTGTTPFDTVTLKQAGFLEFQRMIREDAPERPSIRVSTTGDARTARHRGGIEPATLSRALRGDLDWIVLRALEKDRGRRYSAASEMAEDVRRHLRGEAVAAGPPGAGYRLRKFLGRHRALVVSVALVAVAILAGFAATTAALFRADRNAEEARTQAGRAYEAVDFLLSTLSLADPEIALDPEASVEKLLDATSEQIEGRFHDDPGAEMRVRAAIGGAFENLGTPAKAEHHLRRAVALYDTHGATRDFDALDFHDLLWTLTNVCFELERDDSFAVSTRARAAGVACLAPRSSELAAAVDEFAAAVERGAWSLEADALGDVTSRLDRMLRLAGSTLEADDRAWSVLVNVLLAAGYTVWYTPHEPYAERFWGEALAIQRRTLRQDHPDAAETVSLLVGVLNGLGKTERAEELIRDSIERLRRVLRDDAVLLAIAEGMLGETLTRQGRFEEALPVLERSHARILTAVRDPANWRALESSVRLIELFDAWGRDADARPHRDTLARSLAYGKYLPLWTQVAGSFPESCEDVAALGHAIQEGTGGASLLAAPGTVADPALSERIAEFVVAADGRFEPGDPRRLALARALLGWAHALAPDAHAADRAALAEAALPILREARDDLPFDFADACGLLARDATRRGDAAAAGEHAREAWEAVLGRPDAGIWYTASMRVRIAEGLMAGGLLEPAESLLEPAYERITQQLGRNHPEARWTRGLLRGVHERLGRLEDARLYAEPRSAAESYDESAIGSASRPSPGDEAAGSDRRRRDPE